MISAQSYSVRYWMGSGRERCGILDCAKQLGRGMGALILFRFPSGLIHEGGSENGCFVCICYLLKASFRVRKDGTA